MSENLTQRKVVMSIKDFNCCGTNKHLVSRSEAKKVVRGFRQDLKEGLVDWQLTFGFCYSCGSEFTYFDAVSQKDLSYCIDFYNKQIKASTRRSLAHKIRRNGGLSISELKRLEKNQHSDSKMMKRFWDRRIEAISKIKTK